MDDLRSLEGVGHLLSEKMTQNKQKKTHKRSTSVPNTINGTSSITSQTLPSNYIAISAQFPPQLAAALASGINIGYYQKPTLLKSHSVFASSAKNIPHFDEFKSSGGQVTFTDQYQPVVSPTQSMSPPLSPSAVRGLTLQNQFGSNRSSNRSSAHASALWQAIPESPSFRLTSISGGGLQLDLTDVLVDEAITPRGSSAMWHFPLEKMNSNGMPVIQSPDAMEYGTSPDEDLADLPPTLKKTYSNNSLFTLYGGEDMSSVEDDLVASNTRLNSVIGPSHLPILENGNMSEIEFESLNLKEDFMEYQNEQKDSFNNIGMGASGVVRKAFHFRSCKMVAIKQCRSKHPSLTNGFIKEATLYRKFEDCPYIVNILGFGKDSDNGTLAMAMEYMDLGSCDSLKLNATENKLTIQQKELVAGHIILNTLKALVELHSLLYVHNDIKPANILCNKYGEIKLSDFGTVLRMKDATHKLRRNNGTQRYQSPEKLIHQPIEYDTKSDIFSLGVTAYELLFGTAYNSTDELAFVNHPPKLTPKEHGLSSECCDFIMKCFEIEHTKRLSASDLVQHEWFSKHIETIHLREKWPWLYECEIEMDTDDVDLNTEVKPATTNTETNGTKKKQVSFAFPPDTTEKNGAKSYSIRQHHFYNEDLLFMISALIIYYSSQSMSMDLASDSMELHRRQSNINSKVKSYSDQERIQNMAKYALCSQQMVIDRIKVTVAFIKAQINKLEKL